MTGEHKRVESARNRQLQIVARLAAGRRSGPAKGLFLVEGARAVRTCLESGAVEFVAVRDGPLSDPVQATLNAADAAGLHVLEVDRAAFDKATATTTPPGILAVAHERAVAIADLLEAAAKSGQRAAVAVAVGLRDPGNLGTIIRSARALGFAGLVVVEGTVDPWSPKVVRATAGSVACWPVARTPSLASLRQALDAAGFSLMATVAHGGNEPSRTHWPKRVALAIGSEADGLSDQDQDLCHHTLCVDTAPDVESLNAASAFAIVAHCWRVAP